VRTKFLTSTALAALALLSLPGPGKAQDAYQGKFTLPFEAHWGKATLPAGDYTIALPKAVAPYMLTVQGQGKNVMVFTGAAADEPAAHDSALTVSRIGTVQVITGLRAAELGLTFTYLVPKSLTTPGADIKNVARVNVPLQTIGGPVAAR
jgi:hypothetical protein